jgi:hypothetical protein
LATDRADASSSGEVRQSPTIVTVTGAVIAEPKRGFWDRPNPERDEAEFAVRSSFFGTSDQYCHILVGSPPYRFTSCGQRLDPPVAFEQSHPQPPCPNGNPPCPECLIARTVNDP